MDKPWYQLSPDEALQALESSRSGISVLEANRHLRQHGSNLLSEEGQKGLWPIFYNQLSDIMIFIPLVVVLAWAVGDLTDTLMILVIVVLNVSLGFGQRFGPRRTWLPSVG